MKRRLSHAAGTILQNRYRIVRQLGSGGMGAVYEAVDERINKPVAVKETFADDEYSQRAFEREAKLLARIDHHAFPRVTDYFGDGDGYYLVMDLIRGDDISEILTNRPEPFEVEQVCRWADEILEALEILHAQNIIHRDIKPANLKLTPQDRIKLLDFGIAKGTSADASSRTNSSIAAATLQFAPLEQVLRASPDWYVALSVNHAEKTEEILQKGTDQRSDLYAVGATLYEMLTKRLPENAPTRALALWSGHSDKLIPAHEINLSVPKNLSDLITEAMALEGQSRPKSAANMRKHLRYVSLSLDKPLNERETFNADSHIGRADSTQDDETVLLTSKRASLTEVETRLKSRNSSDTREKQLLEKTGLARSKGSSRAIPIVIFSIIVLGLVTWSALALVNYFQANQNQSVASNTSSNINPKNIPRPNSSVNSTTASVMDNIKVEFKTTGEDIAFSVNMDGKTSYPTVTLSTPVVLEPKESLELSYLKLKAASARMTINGMEIPLPTEATDTKGKYIQIKINAETLPQLLQSGTTVVGAPASNSKTTLPVTKSTPKPVSIPNPPPSKPGTTYPFPPESPNPYGIQPSKPI